MSTIPNVLANGESLTASGTDVAYSEIRGEDAREVQYELLIESVSGSPTSASLAARIQRWMPIAGGSTNETGGTWVDLLGPASQTFSLTATGTNDQTANIRYLHSLQIGDFAAAGTGYATVLLRDGSTSGAIYDQVNVPAAGSIQRNWTHPLHFPSGLLIHVTGLGTGITVRGSAFGSFDNNYPSLLPGGAFPTILATQALASPRLVTRKVAGGMRTRLVVTPTFSGGTSPKFVISAMAYTRM